MTQDGRPRRQSQRRAAELEQQDEPRRHSRRDMLEGVAQGAGRGGARHPSQNGRTLHASKHQGKSPGAPKIAKSLESPPVGGPNWSQGGEQRRRSSSSNGPQVNSRN